MRHLKNIETGKLDSQDDPALEEFDLLSEPDEPAQEVWPRNTAYVQVNGRIFKVHVEEVLEDHPDALTPEELKHFMVGTELFIPRTAVESWLDIYLNEAGSRGALREQLLKDAALAGHSARALQRAAKAIGVAYVRKGFGTAQVIHWYRNEGLAVARHTRATDPSVAPHSRHQITTRAQSRHSQHAPVSPCLSRVASDRSWGRLK